MTDDTLNNLKALDYPARVEFDQADKLFVVSFPDLPGCAATGPTAAEAYENAQEAKAEWLGVALEHGLPIPEPTTSADYSGRILVRMPTSLHQILADRARLHETSLNQYIVHLLSAAAVGDQITSQLDELRAWVTNIDWRLAELAADVKGIGTYAAQTNFRTTTALSPPSQMANVVVGMYHSDPSLQATECRWEPDFGPNTHTIRGASRKKHTLLGQGGGR